MCIRDRNQRTHARFVNHLGSRANAVVGAKDACGGVGEGSQKIRDLFQIKRVNSVKKLFRCSFGIIFHSLGREDNFIWRIVVGGRRAVSDC